MTAPVPRPPSEPADVAALLVEVERLRDATRRAVAQAAPNRPSAPLPADLSPAEARVVELLGRVRDATLSEPTLARAITAFLVGEGRRFAQTDDGTRWLTALRDAPEVERLRAIWEATTLNVLDDDTEDGVPAAWIELIADVAATADVDRVVTALRPAGLA